MYMYMYINYIYMLLKTYVWNLCKLFSENVHMDQYTSYGIHMWLRVLVFPKDT